VVKLTALVSVFNAMEYLPYSLGAMYPHVDEIVIFDGLISKFNQDGSAKHKGGSSTDGTVEFVQGYDDPDKKITLDSREWAVEKQKRQAMLDRATGDWVATIDSDEVYKDEDFRRVRARLEKTKLCSIWVMHYRFCHDFRWFYRWPGAVFQKNYKHAKLYGLRELLYDETKCYKWPYPNSKGTNRKEWNQRCTLLPEDEAVCYHYSNVCSETKARLKKQISVGLGHKMKGWDAKSFGKGLSWREYVAERNLVEFSGEHPEIMRKHPYYAEAPKWQKELLRD